MAVSGTNLDIIGQFDLTPQLGSKHFMDWLIVLQDLQRKLTFIGNAIAKLAVTGMSMVNNI